MTRSPKPTGVRMDTNSRPNSRPSSNPSPSAQTPLTPQSDIIIRKKKKNKQIPLSIEEIFSQVSIIAASNLNPPPGRIVLTPRSAEVCLKYGTNPEILKIRDIDSFWEPGVDPAVQRMRHEAYVQRRHEVMKQCRLERKRMINAEFKTATNLSPETGMTPEMILEQQKQQNSTLIQMELQRIEKMQKRQEKELEQMISYEINRAKVQQDMEKRFQEIKKKDEIRKKQQEKRFKLMAEERRLRDLQKMAMEEAEEEVRKRAAQGMHERDRALAEERARKLTEERRRLQEEEVEKKRKHEEHKQQLQRYFLEEQLRLRERLEAMNAAEKKKQDAILKKQQDLAVALKQKREMVEKRIERNMSMAQMIEEKRKNDFMLKQEQFESIRAEHQTKLEEERRLHAQELELQEQRRRMILLQQRREEEKKAESLLGKFEEEEQHVQEVFEARARELSLHKEKKSLRNQMKSENVERVMRVSEYKRLNTLKKIEDSDGRIHAMTEQRRSLIQDRRRHAAAARTQKESLMKVMEELRTNASKASKIIAKGMSGTVPLKALIQETSSSRSRSRSGGKKLRKSKTTSELLGLSRESVSADASYFEGGEQQSPNARAGTAGSNVKYSVAEGLEAKPYVSPYVTGNAAP